jgi:hypothetical protein
MTLCYRTQSHLYQSRANALHHEALPDNPSHHIVLLILYGLSFELCVLRCIHNQGLAENNAMQGKP